MAWYFAIGAPAALNSETVSDAARVNPSRQELQLGKDFERFELLSMNL